VRNRSNEIGMEVSFAGWEESAEGLAAQPKTGANWLSSLVFAGDDQMVKITKVKKKQAIATKYFNFIGIIHEY